MNRPIIHRKTNGLDLVIIPKEDTGKFDIFLKTSDLYRHTIPLITVNGVFFQATEGADERT